MVAALGCAAAPAASSAAHYVKTPGYFLGVTGSGSLDYTQSSRFQSPDSGAAELDVHATATFTTRTDRSTAVTIFRRRVPLVLMGETYREMHSAGPLRVSVTGAIDDIDDGNHGRAHFACRYDDRFSTGSGIALIRRAGAGWLGAFELMGNFQLGSDPAPYERGCTITSDEPGRAAAPDWHDRMAARIADLTITPAADVEQTRPSIPGTEWGPFGRATAGEFAWHDATLRRRHFQAPVAGRPPDSYTNCVEGYRYADLGYDVSSCSRTLAWSGLLDVRKRCPNGHGWFLYQRSRASNGGNWYCLKRGQHLAGSTH